MSSVISDLYDIIPTNVVYRALSEKRRDRFSKSESEAIYHILNDVKYVMDKAICDTDGRYLLAKHKAKIECLVDSLIQTHNVYYLHNFISFTKYEDDYILISFAKDNLVIYPPNSLRTTDRTYDVRFGVMCDDLDGVLQFYKDQMTEDFITKVMLGKSL